MIKTSGFKTYRYGRKNRDYRSFADRDIADEKQERDRIIQRMKDIEGYSRIVRRRKYERY